MLQQDHDKKMKVKKGWMAVQVGLEDEDGGFQRFSIPISYLYHPLFQRLLDKAREVYGYHADGPLMLPAPSRISCTYAGGLKRRPPVTAAATTIATTFRPLLSRFTLVENWSWSGERRFPFY
ncbi:UNVERIFIED_CONTAM: Auxin-responsive protein SAUR15 [Sesamum calycinum]|uniref:Auxin-responsive protein SAUR15 n=1 Tax=Sesamum calycinum TaxID=2727403 RepID=A0AAW2MNI6_9LAMI